MLNPGPSNPLTDYKTELQRIDNELVELQRSGQAAPYLYRLYARTSLNGNLKELRQIEKQIDRALESIDIPDDLCLLKANLDFKLHRLAEAKRDLHRAPALLTRRQGRILLAGIDFEEGRYVAAQASLATLAAEDPTWDVLSRIAHIEAKLGDIEKAEELYLQAEDELTAKEMRSFSWIELQRGLLDLSRGCIDYAIEHYNCAERAYSGHWLTAEHLRDAHAAQRGATASHRSALENLAVYLESAELGEVHYYHHLAEFYTDVQPDPNEAVKWARKDIALRNNFNTQTALAWALHQAGQTPAALPFIETALSSGVKDAHIFSKAAAIFEASGQYGKANSYQHRAARLNPLGISNHVH